MSYSTRKRSQSQGRQGKAELSLLNINSYGQRDCRTFVLKASGLGKLKARAPVFELQIKALKSWEVCRLEPLDSWKAGLGGFGGFLSFELL